mmetsp:Transcript_9560/g.17230  ORF Transcript_9560/g.17230 Transcript_9560/m.17230 type:complete len:96 (-) Transcript_9560:61-348(-)
MYTRARARTHTHLYMHVLQTFTHIYSFAQKHACKHTHTNSATNRLFGMLGFAEWSNRRRLYSTIFNEVRMANGEGSTLATVVFDIELMAVRRAVP